MTPAQKYECIAQDLNDTIKSDIESGETLRDHTSLIKEMRKHETVLMCLIWNKVLERLLQQRTTSH
jgi:hypothetical protein